MLSYTDEVYQTVVETQIARLRNSMLSITRSRIGMIGDKVFQSIEEFHALAQEIFCREKWNLPILKILLPGQTFVFARVIMW